MKIGVVNQIMSFKGEKWRKYAYIVHNVSPFNYFSQIKSILLGVGEV